MAKLFQFLEDPIPYYAVYAYLTIIYALYHFVKDRDPLISKSLLKKLLAAHNFFLCFLSVIMAWGFGTTIWNVLWLKGFQSAYCGVNDVADAPMYFWTNVFYATKFYELLDTVFLILEKKTPIFLHLWHHSWVLLVPFVAIRHGLYFGWITAFNNCTVHIAMYYYYGVRSLGYNVWWRRYLTQLQMFQFLIDNVSSLLFAYYKLTGVPCSGTWTAWALGNAIGFSFLLMFLRFYRDESAKRKMSSNSGVERSEAPPEPAVTKQSAVVARNPDSSVEQAAVQRNLRSRVIKNENGQRPQPQ